MSAPRESTGTSDFALGILLVLWQAVRLPVVVLLRLAEPLVRLTLCALGLLSLLMALFYAFLTSVPHRPYVPLLAFAVACGLVLLLYEAVLHRLSR
jgi:hypothetical protein